MDVSPALDVGSYPAPYTIESEAILVTGGDGTTSLSIGRGMNGTVPAAHAEGVSVTSGWGGGSGSLSVTDGTTTVDAATSLFYDAAASVSDGGGGQAVITPGAGVQTVSLLGPFNVSFDTMGIDGTGGTPTSFANGGFVDLGAVPDGAVIISAFPLVVTDFNGSGANNQHLSIDIQPANDPNNSTDISIGWLPKVDATAPTVFNTNLTSDVQRAAQAISGAHLMAYYIPGGGSTPTAGEVDFYALIATPS